MKNINLTFHALEIKQVFPSLKIEKTHDTLNITVDTWAEKIIDAVIFETSINFVQSYLDTKKESL